MTDMLGQPRTKARPGIQAWTLSTVSCLLYVTVVAALVHDATVREWVGSQGALERSGARASLLVDHVALIEKVSHYASDPATRVVYHGSILHRTWNLVIPGKGALSEEENTSQVGLHDTGYPGLGWEETGVWPSDWVSTFPYYVEDGYVVVALRGKDGECRKPLEAVSAYTLSRIKAGWSDGMPFEQGMRARRSAEVSWAEPGNAMRTCLAGGGDRKTFLMRFDLQPGASAHAGP